MARTATPDTAPSEALPDHSPEPDHVLAQVIAEFFRDEEHLAAYELLVEQYPAAQIKGALERALQFPADPIRKSKGALFRYLLTKNDRSTSYAN